MKKKIMLVICISMLVLVGCNKTKFENTNDISQNVINSDVKFETIKTHDYPVSDTVLRIDSLKDWENYKYKDRLKESFIEEELEEKSIFIIQKELTSGSIKLIINNAEIKDNTLVVDIELEYPEMGTEDMAAGFFIFSCDKNIKDIIIN